MKTLQNVLEKKSLVKSISAFEHFSLNANQMNCVKGGTEPTGGASQGGSSTGIPETSRI